MSQYLYEKGLNGKAIHYFGMAVKHDNIDDEFMEDTLYFVTTYDANDIDQKYVIDSMKLSFPKEEYLFKEGTLAHKYKEKYDEIMGVLIA